MDILRALIENHEHDSEERPIPATKNAMSKRTPELADTETLLFALERYAEKRGTAPTEEETPRTLSNNRPPPICNTRYGNADDMRARQARRRAQSSEAALREDNVGVIVGPGSTDREPYDPSRRAQAGRSLARGDSRDPDPDPAYLVLRRNSTGAWTVQEATSPAFPECFLPRFRFERAKTPDVVARRRMCSPADSGSPQIRPRATTPRSPARARRRTVRATITYPYSRSESGAFPEGLSLAAAARRASLGTGAERPRARRIDTRSRPRTLFL
ncbi:hypothetical protein HPB47_010736 [Ixodes persulcatus]|uniref:Uncharacterized protein n=1 Tax=Ixodes persulcatus TaxID=34615 RepID=A0AC60NYB0_IXOPE|nr:hypothetical protein HPB47_010736 [Ixodes persulcatus]